MSNEDLDFDPLADLKEENSSANDLDNDIDNQQNPIHIRIQQRNGRKTLTTLQGVPKEYDLKKILKAFKKDFACNGTLVDDDEAGQVIQLQGDHRTKIREFLLEEGFQPDAIKMHGF